jgi:hypothetical protein
MAVICQALLAAQSAGSDLAEKSNRLKPTLAP